MRIGTCRLDQLARVSLGYKSLQNLFFYVDSENTRRYEIEDRFLRKIYRLRDLDATVFFQTPKDSQKLLYCQEEMGDLRGTGAFRYIRDMALRPAVVKKQAKAKPVQTIQEVLEQQGGRLWYAPKAKPHRAHIWLRKAVDGLYAPFIFENTAAVDQRCNSVRPFKGISWESVAAVLTCSLFALAAESRGGASMGAGALELATKPLRSVPVVDVRMLGDEDVAELVALARMVWKNDLPHDWRKGKLPGQCIQELDEWLLRKLDAQVTLKKLYDDIASACSARLRLAADKAKKAKEAIAHDLDAVADSIAAGARPLLDGKQFPEAFMGSASATFRLSLPAASSLVITVQPMLSDSFVSIATADSNTVLHEKLHPRAVAQVILHALMLGRREFDAPLNESVANETLQGLFSWLPSILEQVERGCTSTAFGTKYEEELTRTTLKNLGLHPKVGQSELFGNFQVESERQRRR